MLFLLSTWHFYYYVSKMPDFWLGVNCWAWSGQTIFFQYVFKEEYHLKGFKTNLILFISYKAQNWTLSVLSDSALTACSSVLLGTQENRAGKATTRQRIHSRWQLLYTLINNPSLLGSRKHFQTTQTSENVLNGTPNHSSKKGSKKEADKPTAVATAAAEAKHGTETPTDQAKEDWDPFKYWIVTESKLHARVYHSAPSQ